MSSNIKKHILVICGDPRILAEMKKDLMDSFEVSLANSSEAALTALDVYHMSAVVINIGIGETRDKAFSVFGSIFGPVKSGHIPIIFLAEKGNDEDETKAFAMGAADYSARRHGTIQALIKRINLRITASENEIRVLTGENAHEFTIVNPEEVLVGKTILLAEDIEINREIVSAMLSDIEGLVLDFACDGAEAVEQFKKNPDKYALILMDIQMPVMNGIEATKIIRSLDCENARDVPIIALTADTQEKEIEVCLGAGMNDFIAKPLDVERLMGVAAEHCL